MRPATIVLLGATAAQALLGNTFRVSENRGELLSLPIEIDVDPAPLLSATVHPSSVLRARVDREKAYQQLVADLSRVRANLATRE